MTGNTAELTGMNVSSRNLAHALLTDGKITQHDHDFLVGFITFDVASAAYKSSVFLKVANHISICRNITPRQIEAVADVFNTPELLAMILLLVPAADLILVVPLVCKGFHQAIEASLELKRKTHRLAATSPITPLVCFPVKIPGFESYNYKSYEDVIKLKVRLYKMREEVTRDARFRSYQVGRPPIKSALFFSQEVFEPRDSVCLPDSPPEAEEIWNSTGITLGDILDAVERNIKDVVWSDRDCKVEYTFFCDTEISEQRQSARSFEKWLNSDGKPGLWY